MCCSESSLYVRYVWNSAAEVDWGSLTYPNLFLVAHIPIFRSIFGTPFLPFLSSFSSIYLLVHSLSFCIYLYVHIYFYLYKFLYHEHSLRACELRRDDTKAQIIACKQRYDNMSRAVAAAAVTESLAAGACFFQCHTVFAFCLMVSYAVLLVSRAFTASVFACWSCTQ